MGTAEAGDSVSNYLANNKVTFISGCTTVHTAAFAFFSVYKLELQRQCEQLDAYATKRLEELQGLRNDILQQGGCSSYSSDFTAFNDAWDAKISEARSQMEQLQTIVGVVKGIISNPSGRFSSSDKTRAANIDLTQELGWDVATCTSLYSVKYSHNFLDTLDTNERTEVTLNGHSDETYTEWAITRTVYLDCNYDHEAGKDDPIAAWTTFAQNFGVSESRRLQGPPAASRQLEAE